MDFRLCGAKVLHPGGPADAPLSIAGGHIAGSGGRDVDLSGYMVLPGIVDIHGDGFERHVAPRRGAMKDVATGLVANEAELAANGITTAVLAQFYSWEGGMRGPEFAARVLEGLDAMRGAVATDLHAQLRIETCMLDGYDGAEALIAQHDIPYVVFNDHLPHEALAKGKRPPRLTGQALRIGKNPEKHLADLQAMHARLGEVPGAVAALSRRLMARGVRLGSHDDRSADQRKVWHDLGVRIAEFPETLEGAEAAHGAGDAVIMGAPNLARGGSHKENTSAVDLVAMGLVGALASDYHYPSLSRAAFLVADAGLADLAGAWALVSSGPAAMLGLHDRGTLAPGLRADIVILDAATRRIAATLAAGRFSYLSGGAAERFLAA